MIWTDLAFGPRYLGLNVGKNKFGLKFFFFWLGHELGPIPKWGLARAGPGLGKKPGTLNGPGSGHKSCPAGRVQIRPVAIPNCVC